MDEKVHLFPTEQSLKRRTRILAKAIFLQRKILQVQKMQSCDGMTDMIYYI